MFVPSLLWAAQTFASDARLAKPIAIAEYVVPAPRVCADLTKLIGVPVSCDPELRDDLLVLVVKQRPAREIMNKVASTFGWQWLPRDAGYQLTPTEAFLRRAATGREAILANEGRRRQQAARDYLKAVQIQDRTAIPLEPGRVTAFPRYLESPSAQAAQRLNPATMVALTALAELDPYLTVRLADQRLVVSPDPGPLEVRMEAGALRASQACIDALRKMANSPDGATEAFGTNALTFQTAEPRFAVVQLDSWASANVLLVAEDGSIVSLSPTRLPKPKPLPLAPLPASLEAALLQPRPDNASNPPASFGATDVDSLGFFADHLTWVATSLGCDVVSDAYDSYADASGDQSVPKMKLGREREDGFNPICEGGWLTNRNSQWPRRREEQVPRSILHDLDRPIDMVPIDERAEIVSRLTVPQLKSPFCPVTPEEYWFFRFWRGLSTAFRDALRAGKKFKLGDLPDSVVPYLYEVGETPEEEDPSPLATVSWGGSSLFTEPDFMDYEKLVERLRPSLDLEGGEPPRWPGPMNNDFASLYPARIDPNSPVWLQAVDIPSMYDVDDRQSYSPGFLAQIEDWEAALSPLSSATRLKIARSRALRLHIGLRKGLEVQADVSETVLGDDIAKDRTKWPKELLNRISRRRELQKELDNVMGQSTAPPPSKR